jgi:hypothetical protein
MTFLRNWWIELLLALLFGFAFVKHGGERRYFVPHESAEDIVTPGGDG